METVASYTEFVSRIEKSAKAVLLLYRKGSDQSTCAYRNLEEAAAGNELIRFYTADVNVVKDIHGPYGVDSVPSLLVFDDGKLTSIVKGCQEASFYKAMTENSLFRPSASSEGKPAKRVTVYSTPSCSWCNTLKTWLGKNNIQYTDIDVSRDQAAAEALVRRSGQQGVPQTDINGQIVVGFDQARLKQLLEIQ